MNKLIEGYSREATRNFVQTIVVLDDEASFDEPQISELTQPSPFDDNEPEPSESDNANPRLSPTRFNANEFVQAAAKAGVVGSVIKANLNELEFDVVTNVAKRADILVFDWKLGESDVGETTTRLISEIIGLDAGNRKRFICVYTGETDLDDYAEELRDSLGDDWEVCRQKADDRDQLKVCNRSKLVDVVFCNKAEVAVEKLPVFLLQEYAESIVLKKTATNEDGQECIETVAGILPSLVMDTISAIRDTTHSLLARYSADLDGALFMHYFKLLAGWKEKDKLQKIKENASCVKWASEQTSEFIMHEICVAIQSVIETYVEKSDELHSVFTRYAILANEEFNKNKNCQVCLQKEECDKALKTEKTIRPYWRLTCNETYNNIFRFASLCQFARDIQTPSLISPDWTPVLRTGTVLKKDNQAYICIQAPCDCERCSKEKNSFLFLSVIASEALSDKDKNKEKEKKKKDAVFFFGLPDGSIKVGETKLEVEAFEKIRFCYEEEEADRPIRSKSKAAPYVFKEWNDANDKQDDGVKSSDEGNEYYWIGDLRSEVVTMLIQKFYRKMSRFGMNEFEWLRQLTQNKEK